MTHKPLVLFFAVGALALVCAAQEPSAQKTSAPAVPTPVAPAATPAAKPVSSMNARQIAELRADILVARKMYFQGIAAYQQLLKSYPRDAGLLNKIGIAYQEMGDFRNAGHYYKQSSRADHGFASPLNNLGTVEYQEKKYGKAVKLYQKALTDHGEAATVYCNLGYAYFADKQYSQAMDSFHQAVALDPRIFEHRSSTGSIVQQRTVSDPGLFYFFLAKSYAEAGDAEQCARYLKLAGDHGYAEITTAQSDPAFARVIRDPRIQEVLPSPPAAKPATE